MKIAYIGNFEPEYSTENDVRKAFEYLYHEVIKVQENGDISKLYDYDYDLLLMTGTWDNLHPLEKYIDIFYECAIRNIPTATLHLDTFWGKSRGNRKWWQHPMFHTAYIFTADGDYQDMWRRFGKHHYWLPPAIRHSALGRGTYRPEYACDVAFVGSNGEGYHEDVWGYRKELVDNLREMCKRHDWTFKNPGGDDHKINRDNDMNDFYESAKVTIGDSLCLKKDKSHYWSDRVPEATGRHGFLIMPDILAMKEVYGDTIPTYRWGDFQDLEEKIEYYLRNKLEKEELKRKAFDITAESETYVNRVKTILTITGVEND